MFIQELPPQAQVVAEYLNSIPAPAPALPSATTFDDVLILNRGDNIRVVGSGIIWSVIAVKGRMPDGQTRFFYKTVGRPGEPVPPISSRCRIEGRLAQWTGGLISGENDLPRLEGGSTSHPQAVDMWSLDRFECSISSESPVIVPSGYEEWVEPTSPVEEKR